MRVFMGGAVRPELLERSDAELMGMAKREVQALFGPATPPAHEHMVRWPRAMPQYLVGHVERVRTIRALASAAPGLELIGNAYDGVGIPQCVRGAKQAVLRQAAQWGKAK
jgi:oxygen-dependent protoporphyrinogen oxidase